MPAFRSQALGNIQKFQALFAGRRWRTVAVSTCSHPFRRRPTKRETPSPVRRSDFQRNQMLSHAHFTRRRDVALAPIFFLPQWSTRVSLARSVLLRIRQSCHPSLASATAIADVVGDRLQPRRRSARGSGRAIEGSLWPMMRSTAGRVRGLHRLSCGRRGGACRSRVPCGAVSVSSAVRRTAW